MKRLLPTRWFAKRTRRLAVAYFLGMGLLPAGLAAAHRGQAQADGPASAAALVLAMTGPWRAHEGVELAGRVVTMAFEGRGVHGADWAACEARWGAELGRLLCPAIFAANEGRGVQQNLELGLLAALWHVSRHRAAVAYGDVSARAAKVGAWLRPLLVEDPL